MTMTDKELLTAISNIVSEQIEPLKTDLNDTNRKVTSIELTLENVTNRNIMLIAEGHSILNRKLDEIMKTENDVEIYKIRLNLLEKEIREIKEYIQNHES